MAIVVEVTSRCARARQVARAAHPVLLSATLLLCCACGSPPPNLVLVVVDTLRADHLGSYGYERDTSPAIDALAADAVLFERAYATAPWTMPSVASILTGQHPGRHGLMGVARPLPDEAISLAERLSEAGYRTAAVTSHVLLEARYGFGQGFDVFHARSGGHQALTGGLVTRAAVGAIRDLAGADGGPFFLFVHYFDPHYVYRDHPELDFAGASLGRVRSAMPFPELMAMRHALDADELDFVRALYDEEVRFTDAQIGRLLAALHDAGVREDTVIAVTADHGEAFMEHGWIGHTTLLRDTVLRVPLVLRPAGHRGGAVVVETPVSLVALAPTLLELLGVPAEAADFDGVSLAPLLRGEAVPPEPVLSQVDYRQHRALRTSKRMLLLPPHKLIEDRLARRAQLFDLSLDPGEHRDIASERPDLVASLRARLEAVAPAARDDASPAPDLSEDERRHLRELGYVD